MLKQNKNESNRCNNKKKARTCNQLCFGATYTKVLTMNQKHIVYTTTMVHAETKQTNKQTNKITLIIAFIFHTANA